MNLGLGRALRAPSEGQAEIAMKGGAVRGQIFDIESNIFFSLF